MIGIYRRLSLSDGDLGIDGKDESNSIDTQQMIIEEFISSNDDLKDEETRVFTDDGYTGTNFNRPGFKAMVEAAKYGEIDTIIVKDLSRFGRDYIGVGEYLEETFPMLGVRFIAICNNYDSNNYHGETLSLDVVVSNLINTMYSRDSGKKLYTANTVKWKKGLATYANAPFGYLMDPNPERKGKFVVDSEAAAIVRSIFDKALAGKKTGLIAYELNEEGKPIPSAYNRLHNLPRGQGAATPKSKADPVWTAGRVVRILSAYEYTGAMVIGKRKSIDTGGKIRRKTEKKDWYITEGVNEAIVTKEEWEQAQAIKKTANSSSFRHNTQFPLKSKLFCKCCGRRLIYRYLAYDTRVWCREGYESKHSICPADRYSLNEIDRVVLHSIKLMAAVLNVLDVKIKEFETDGRAKRKSIEKKINLLQNEAKSLKIENMRLYECYASGSMDQDVYLEKKKSLLVKITELNKKETAFRDELPEMIDVSPELREMAAASHGIDIGDELTQELADVFVEGVYLSPGNNIEIHFKCEDVIKRAARELDIEMKTA